MFLCGFTHSLVSFPSYQYEVCVLFAETVHTTKRNTAVHCWHPVHCVVVVVVIVVVVVVQSAGIIFTWYSNASCNPYFCILSQSQTLISSVWVLLAVWLCCVLFCAHCLAVSCTRYSPLSSASSLPYCEHILPIVPTVPTSQRAHNQVTMVPMANGV